MSDITNNNEGSWVRTCGLGGQEARRGNAEALTLARRLRSPWADLELRSYKPHETTPSKTRGPWNPPFSVRPGLTHRFSPLARGSGDRAWWCSWWFLWKMLPTGPALPPSRPLCRPGEMKAQGLKVRSFYWGWSVGSLNAGLGES